MNCKKKQTCNVQQSTMLGQELRHAWFVYPIISKISSIEVLAIHSTYHTNPIDHQILYETCTFVKQCIIKHLCFSVSHTCGLKYML